MCMEPWKKHSGSTGGYFQCNRFEATNKVFQKIKQSINEAEDAHMKAAETNKFVHYYTRFKNHEHSLKVFNFSILTLLVQASEDWKKIRNFIILFHFFL